jgi:hypothetical protein
VLFVVYMGVMGAALACFLGAFATRRRTPVHRRWGILGVALDLAGTVVVLVLHRGLGWSLPARDPTVVLWHRGFAYVATALVLAVAVTGWRRAKVHPRIGPVLVPVYAVTLALALVGYWPF